MIAPSWASDALTFIHAHQGALGVDRFDAGIALSHSHQRYPADLVGAPGIGQQVTDCQTSSTHVICLTRAPARAFSNPRAPKAFLSKVVLQNREALWRYAAGPVTNVPYADKALYQKVYTEQLRAGFPGMEFVSYRQSRAHSDESDYVAVSSLPLGALQQRKSALKGSSDIAKAYCLAAVAASKAAANKADWASLISHLREVERLHYVTKDTYLTLTQALWETGEYAQAKARLLEAITQFSSVLTPDDYERLGDGFLVLYERGHLGESMNEKALWAYSKALEN